MPIPTPTELPIPTPMELPILTPTELPIPTPTELPSPTPMELLILMPTELPIPTPTELPIPTSSVSEPRVEERSAGVVRQLRPGEGTGFPSKPRTPRRYMSAFDVGLGKSEQELRGRPKKTRLDLAELGVQLIPVDPNPARKEEVATKLLEERDAFRRLLQGRNWVRYMLERGNNSAKAQTRRLRADPGDMKFHACLRSRALSRVSVHTHNHHACCTEMDLEKSRSPDRHPDTRTIPSRHSHAKISCPLFVLISRQAQPSAFGVVQSLLALRAFVEPKGLHSSSLRSGGAILSISRSPPSETVREDSSRASQAAHKATDQVRDLTHKYSLKSLRFVMLF